MRSCSGVAAALAVLMTASAASAQSAIRSGDILEGRLSADDRVLYDGTYFDCFVLDARPGERVTVKLESSDFDAFLSVTTRGSCDSASDQTDDDGAGGTNAELPIQVGSGRYIVRANSVSEGETGAYRLSVRRSG